MNKKISRRSFVEDAAYVAVGSLCVGLVGCESSAKAQKVPQEGETFSCSDTTGLTPDQISARTNLNYVDKSAIPSKRCDNCSLWLAQESGKKCGGCKIMKGPIHPGGFCTAWVAAS